MSWLNLLVESTKELEPPERFWWWSGIAVISALVRKNVYLDRFSYKLYPNVYVMLVSAKSGLRKGVPVLQAKDIVSEVNSTRIISGRNSVQGILKELATQKTLPDGRVFNEAQAFLCAPELTSFLVHDPEGLNILLDLQGTHEHEKGWHNTLKSSPVEELKNPCITFLSAINEPLFEDLMREKDIKGGLIARMFVVHESKKRTVNDLLDKPQGMLSALELAEPLRDLPKLKGQFILAEEAKREYRAWYIDLNSKNFADLTGSIERLGDQVLKVAMIISLARGRDMIISHEDVTIAIANCQQCILGTTHVTMGAGTHENALGSARVLKLLIAAEGHQLSRKKILQKLWPDADAGALDKILDTLLQSGALDDPFRDEKREIIYRMKKEHVQQYLRFKSEEQ